MPTGVAKVGMKENISEVEQAATFGVVHASNPARIAPSRSAIRESISSRKSAIAAGFRRKAATAPMAFLAPRRARRCWNWAYG